MSNGRNPTNPSRPRPVPRPGTGSEKNSADGRKPIVPPPPKPKQ